MVQHSQGVRRMLDLAREEAERFGHRYLGPEHLVLGMLGDGRSQASRVHRTSLWRHGGGLGGPGGDPGTTTWGWVGAADAAA